MMQWILLVVGCIFLIISVYSLFRDFRRDKVIAICVFLFCLLGYFLAELRINSHNSKAEIYPGTHQLSYYNNSEDYKIEILQHQYLASATLHPLARKIKTTNLQSRLH